MKQNRLPPDFVSSAIRAIANARERWKTLVEEAAIGKTAAIALCAIAVAYVSFVLLASKYSVPGAMLVVIVPLLVFWVLSFAAQPGLKPCGNSEGWLPSGRIFLYIFLPHLAIALCSQDVGPDITWQFQQVRGELPWDDWHPVLHTAYLWALSFGGRVPWLAKTLQILAFSSLLAWAYTTLRKFSFNRFATLLAIVAAAASSYGVSMAACMLKDVAFALAALAATVMLVNIYETKGAWLYDGNSAKALLKIASFAFILFFASFARHNGFFYTIPLALLLPLCVDRKHTARCIAVAMCAVALAAGYISLRTHLQHTGAIIDSAQGRQKFTESILLPMSMMSEVYVADKGNVPDDLRGLMEQICDRSMWKSRYLGNFDSIKFDLKTYPEIVSKYKDRFWNLFMRTVTSNPSDSIKSFLRVTSIAWSPAPEAPEWKLHTNGSMITWLRDITIYKKLATMFPGGSLANAPGTYLTILIAALAIGIIRKGWKSAVLAVPLVCYSFGTMLFLGGPESRFFYAVSLSGGIASLALLGVPPMHKKICNETK